MRSRSRLATLYPRELTDATLDLAERCTFSLDELRYEYPEELVPAGTTPAGHLRQLVEAGLRRRYGDAPVKSDVRELIDHELALIAELQYEPYFLTVHDIVAFARSQDILCQGRGSAANSAVCYALGITEVDPSRMSVLFERFVSRERNEPPDIDVDFEHQRREEVMQYVYRKYGRERAALAATLITYRPKSAVRDVGKALGLDLAQVERLTGVFAWWDGRKIDPERIREAGFDPDNPLIARLVALAGDLQRFPRHLSQHVGGFVIARDLLERMVPVENAAMADRTVIQWDKDDLDALGLLKVDCLALGMLSAIRRCLAMISQKRGSELRMQDIPAEDPGVYAMCQRADTIGVFQIESRAQQSMLPRLKPASFYDLVVEVAIVRPGPIQGGMVHPYLKRRQGKEPVTYPSEAVKGVLERTLGIPIFQEQVMQLAIVAAGFTAGRGRPPAPLDGRVAAQGRPREIRAASGRRHGRARLSGGLRTADLPADPGLRRIRLPGIALRVVRAAGLRVGMAQALRTRGVLRRAAQFAADGLLRARATGAGRAPPRRRGSAPPTSRSANGTARWSRPRCAWGCAWSAACPKPARSASSPRATPRPSRTWPISRIARSSIGTTSAQLAAAGALSSLAGHRHAAAWDVAGVEKLPPLLAGSTFDEAPAALAAPTEGQDIVADYRALGLTLGRHPLALLRGQLRARRLSTSAEVRDTPHGRIVRTAGIVIGRQRPDTASGVMFVTLEDETGATNVIVWRDLSDRQRRELLGARLMGVYGRVEREGIVVHLLAGRLVDLSPLLGSLPTHSRDFH